MKPDTVTAMRSEGFGGLLRYAGRAKPLLPRQLLPDQVRFIRQPIAA